MNFCQGRWTCADETSNAECDFQVEDVNVVFLCRELRSLGWRVNKVVFVGDDVDAISEEVHALSSSHEMVLTAGGVGPTVDDVTMEGVAHAMQTSLSRQIDKHV